MTKRILTISLCAALMGTVLTSAKQTFAGECANRDALSALELRVLQSELMVGALTCGQRASYNAFVNSYKPFLKNQGAQLRTFFVDQFGPSAGPSQLNSLVTRLANAASQRSLGQSNQDFCVQIQDRFNAVLTGNTQSLMQLAQTNPSAADHGFRGCVEVAGTEPQANPDQN